MIKYIQALIVLFYILQNSNSNSVSALIARTTGSSGNAVLTTLVNPDTSRITEELCLDAARRMRLVQVPVPTDVHPDGQVGISYVHWKPTTDALTSNLQQPYPLVLIHGFDSSCLEYRRIGNLLASQYSTDTYAVDLLGWGFTQLDKVLTFGAPAKVQALASFTETVLGANAPFVIAGASLGGAAAMEIASINKNCKGLVLIDAQGFVDGIGPMAALPTPIAKLGAAVLKSNLLRSAANQMSYFDRKTYATEEAVRIGRLHCERDGWSRALVSFMQSGGFAPSKLVPTITVPTLVLWGRQDGILDGKEFANKFVETMPSARLCWVEECGHVPHLEQPQVTADAIATFLKEVTTNSKVAAHTASPVSSKGLFGIGAVGVAGTIAALVADLFPVH
jgi:pimeloyl-ACP methyl ester carboxylesterase